MPAAIKLSFLTLLVLCGSAIGSASAYGETPQSGYERLNSQEVRLVKSAACPASGADFGCKINPDSKSPDIAAILFGSVNNSNECQECIKQWCDWECSGFGDECPSCIKRWCDWEC
jgi:hypothetical protein